MADIVIGGKLRLAKPIANLDKRYGIYESKQAAFDALEDMDALTVGLTIGVMTADGVVEYWFKKACETVDDLVLKDEKIGASSTHVYDSGEESLRLQ